MTARRERCRPSYQVVVQGELKPALLAFCAGPLADHQTSGAFRMRVREDQGIADLVAMLQAAGLLILSIRQVTPAELAIPATMSATVPG
ncbi:hypothetical protein ACIBL3_09900 [Kribbella sp. NPDC050124]|uniref:hypothetical protein n=1 Tax=Kribbella sp. NPDC050124 TaxID=3364114 RepID=UPI0037A034FA